MLGVYTADASDAHLNSAVTWPTPCFGRFHCVNFPFMRWHGSWGPFVPPAWFILITSQPSTSLKAVRVCFQALVVASQSRTVPSLKVDARVRLSGEEATTRTGCYGPRGSVSRHWWSRFGPLRCHPMMPTPASGCAVRRRRPELNGYAVVLMVLMRFVRDICSASLK
jgi:hypothetical protein